MAQSNAAADAASAAPPPSELTAGLPGWPPPSHTDAQGRQCRTGARTLTPEEVSDFQAALAQCQADMPFADRNKLSDEDMLLRAYVAVGGDVGAAVAKVRRSVAWRAAQGIDDIQAWCAERFPEDIVFRTHTDGLMGFYGVDNEGFPVWWERPNSKLFTEFVTDTPIEEADRWHLACIERLRELPRRLGVDRYSMVFDLKDTGSSFIFGKLGQVLRAQMATDKEYYAENMRRLIIINAPFGFSHTFSVIKKILDPRVQDKIIIGGRRAAGDQLSQYVTDANIPKTFGGAADVDWSAHRMRPSRSDAFFAIPYWDAIRKAKPWLEEARARQERERRALKRPRSVLKQRSGSAKRQGSAIHRASVRAAGDGGTSPSPPAQMSGVISYAAESPVGAGARVRPRSHSRSLVKSFASMSRCDSEEGDLITCLTGPESTGSPDRDDAADDVASGSATPIAEDEPSPVPTTTLSHVEVAQHDRDAQDEDTRADAAKPCPLHPPARSDGFQRLEDSGDTRRTRGDEKEKKKQKKQQQKRTRKAGAGGSGDEEEVPSFSTHCFSCQECNCFSRRGVLFMCCGTRCKFQCCAVM